MYISPFDQRTLCTFRCVVFTPPRAGVGWVTVVASSTYPQTCPCVAISTRTKAVAMESSARLLTRSHHRLLRHRRLPSVMTTTRRWSPLAPTKSRMPRCGDSAGSAGTTSNLRVVPGGSSVDTSTNLRWGKYSLIYVPAYIPLRSRILHHRTSLLFCSSALSIIIYLIHSCIDSVCGSYLFLYFDLPCLF